MAPNRLLLDMHISRLAKRLPLAAAHAWLISVSMNVLLEVLHTCLSFCGCFCLEEEFWQGRRRSEHSTALLSGALPGSRPQALSPDVEEQLLDPAEAAAAAGEGSMLGSARCGEGDGSDDGQCGLLQTVSSGSEGEAARCVPQRCEQACTGQPASACLLGTGATWQSKVDVAKRAAHLGVHRTCTAGPTKHSPGHGWLAGWLAPTAPLRLLIALAEIYRVGSFNTKVAVLRSASPFYRSQQEAAGGSNGGGGGGDGGGADIELKPTASNMLLGQAHLEQRGRFVDAHPARSASATRGTAHVRRGSPSPQLTAG